MTLHNVTATSCANVRAAYARHLAAGEPLRIFAAGDSVTAGFQAIGDKRSASYAAKARVLLDGGALGPVKWGFEYLTQVDGSYLDPLRVYGSGWAAANQGSGVVIYGVVAATGPSGDFEFGPVDCDTFTLWTFTAGSPSWRYRIDNGAYSTTQTSTGIVTIPAGSPGLHTVKIIVDSGQLVLRKVDWSGASTRPVQFGITGRFGAMVSLWTGTTGGSTSTALNEVYDALRKPDLVTALLGTNDQNPANGIPVATSIGHWQDWVTRARAEGTDLLMVIPPPFMAGTVLPSAEYRAGMYALADSTDSPLLDLYAEFLGVFEASHPSDAQHALMAAVYADAIEQVIGVTGAPPIDPPAATSWEPALAERWDGSSWGPVAAERWDGSAWEQVLAERAT